MSAPEVQWVLQRIDEYYGAGALSAGVGGAGEGPPLERVDRDESQLLEQGVRSHTAELQNANIVGASLADYMTSVVGTEYDHAVEAIVGLRIAGLHHSEWGHIDPDGSDGAPWSSLVATVRRALLRERTWPAVGRPDVSYTDLQLVNPAPQSSNYGDYYRYDVDVQFRGYEELP
ncbi:hypothetical protein HZS55_15875 [Halosimplex rubrum]|uniref:Uncharacterized protein n=1 Tax=Halosimplex rubrum TaxID=869889 RepID=A0A7D5T7Z5_9EURY|nr:hypothetical protein [Halosimplex rubrum]QLH78675.1 hypothetical protein HZS55_15875 [Halosimplex rubrum]